jgi:dynein intermediate chain 4, axonemal
MNATSGAPKAARPLPSTTGAANASGTSRSGGLLSASSSRYSLRGKGGTTSSSRASGATNAAREEAKRRLQELKGELEGAVHVLDGGVNRTPLPLQHRHSLVGGLPHDAHGSGGGGSIGNGSMRLDMTQDSNATTALMNAELGTSFLHSSFMLNSSTRSNAPKHSLMSADREGSIIGGVQRSRRGGDSSFKSLESSMQSLASTNDRHMAEQSTSVLDSTYRTTTTGEGGSSVMHRGSSTPNPVPRLVQQSTLLTEAAYVRPAPLSEEKKMAWRKAITTITLSETPTIFLYSHHDEAVSQEDAEEVAAVKARNKVYAAVEKAFRIDEGTRFHSTGVATMRAPMKSIQTEVHPPAKKDSGGLQVAPWMLKDAYAATLDSMNGGDDDDNIDDPAQLPQDTGDTEDALHDDAEAAGGGGGGDVEVDEDQSSDAAQSTVLSSDEAATATNAASAADEAGGHSNAAKADVGSSKQWMFADTLLSTLRIVERAVVQNYMEAAQLAYRGIAMDPASRRVPAKAAAEKTNRTIAKGRLQPPPPLPLSPAPAHNPLPPVSVESIAGAGDGANGGSAPPPPPPPRQQQQQELLLLSPHEQGGKADAAIATAANGAGGDSATSGALQRGAFTAAASPVPVRLSDDVRLLWRFGSSRLTRNRGVTCMTWNRRELDMLAVGYTACRAANTRNGSGAPQPMQSDLTEGDLNDGGVVLKRSLGQEAYGMICCWSLKNPLAPELILFLRHEADVTALSFSSEHPSLLAVGSSTGEIVVYDIQRDVVLPSIAPATGTTAGQHTGAVWELQWVPKGKEQGEFLTSISADGRVVQWAVGKSIERVAPDLMHLQRQPGTQVEQAFVDGVAEAEAAAAATSESAAGAGGRHGGRSRPRPPPKRRAVSHGNAGNDHSSGSGGAGSTPGGGTGDDTVLSRQCGGMCLDVCPVDTAIYVVGTEDGSVLQCSKSQTENYDFEYESHAELVYRVRWSPYSASYFLTCSADWTSRLYKVGTSKPQLRFSSVRQDAVQDVAWSPTNALIFATATAQGSVEVWTVMDVMCPRASIEFEDHRHLSAVLFAEQETPVLVVGDEEGDVTVFCLEGSCYTRQDLTDDEQEAWMVEAVRKQLT